MSAHPLDGAAGELQASVERYARELIGAAEARASEVTAQAARKAFDLAGGTATADRTARMLEAIDSIENSFMKSFASLRREAETLLGELENALSKVGNGQAPPDEDWIEKPDEGMTELLFLDELPG